MTDHLTHEIAACAARLVVEEGLEYGPAKRRALRQLRLEGQRKAQLPSNEALEDEVRDYLALFRADTQPQELARLRQAAALWMQRLAQFHPLLCGAVWRGTATKLSTVHLQLFCDDPKAAELSLLTHRVAYEVGAGPGPHGRNVDVLSIQHLITPDGPSGAPMERPIQIYLWVLDTDDIRGLLKPDARGQSERGDLPSLQRLMAAADAPASGAAAPDANPAKGPT